MRINLVRTHRLLLAIILTGTPLIGTQAFAGAGACVRALTADPTNLLKIDGKWRKGDADLYGAFRANAPHFWSWLKDLHEPLLIHLGVVTGDPHLMNFAEVPLQKQGREYGLTDLDDSGTRAPLAGDFLRYFVGNQISIFKVEPSKLWQAYRLGLQGKSLKKPEFLKTVETESDSGFSERQGQYVDKMTKKHKFSEKAGLTRLDEATASVHKLYAQVEASFSVELAGYDILDIGYKIKQGGGSQNLPRFWYLLKAAGGEKIFEFKMLTDPATALYSEQSSGKVRFDEVAKIYRSKSKALGPYKLVLSGSDSFLLRQRFSLLTDFDPTKIADESKLVDGKEMALYLANRIGVWQSGQAAGQTLLAEIERPGAGSEDALHRMAQRYIQKMQQEQGAK